MRKAIIISTIAPAALALILTFPVASHARISAAKLKACQSATSSCMARCNRVFTETSRINACIDRCMATESKCYSSGSPGKVDTGGTGRPPKAASYTSPGGGVLADPKSPPKGSGNTAPILGGLLDQPFAAGSGGVPTVSSNGGNGPILRSSGASGPTSGGGIR